MSDAIDHLLADIERRQKQTRLSAIRTFGLGMAVGFTVPLLILLLAICLYATLGGQP